MRWMIRFMWFPSTVHEVEFKNEFHFKFFEVNKSNFGHSKVQQSPLVGWQPGCGGAQSWMKQILFPFPTHSQCSQGSLVQILSPISYSFPFSKHFKDPCWGANKAEGIKTKKTRIFFMFYTSNVNTSTDAKQVILRAWIQFRNVVPALNS